MSPQPITCPSCLRVLKQTVAGSLYCEVCGPVWIPDPGTATCIQCGSILDGLFLCGWCERDAERELKNQAFKDEFTLHRNSRTVSVPCPEVLEHWRTLKEKL